MGNLFDIREIVDFGGEIGELAVKAADKSISETRLSGGRLVGMLAVGGIVLLADLVKEMVDL
jgi:hypothetical protein